MAFKSLDWEHARSIVNQNKELCENFEEVMEYLGDELRAKQGLFTKADASGARSVSAFTTQTQLRVATMARVVRGGTMQRRMARKVASLMRRLLPKLASSRARRTRLPLPLTPMILESMSLVRFGGQ